MRLFNLKSAVAAVAFAGALIASGSSAQAGDCYHAPPTCHYKTITVYVDVVKPYSYYVTKYDHCYKPYQVEVTGYKTIQVPVQKRIKVCY